jgi:hypothetical protein
VNLVAVGGRAVLLGAGSGDVAYRMASDDGLHWTAEANGFGDVYPRTAATDGTRLWVFGSAPDGRAVVLESADGTSFGPPTFVEALGREAGFIGAGLVDGRPVAIATRGPAAGVLRQVADGSWEIVEAGGLVGDHVARIVTVDGHLVALGDDEVGTPSAWTSADGSSWRSLTLPAMAPGTTLQGVAVRDGIAVIVGQVTSGETGVGAAWTGSAELLAP